MRHAASSFEINASEFSIDLNGRSGCARAPYNCRFLRHHCPAGHHPPIDRRESGSTPLSPRTTPPQPDPSVRCNTVSKALITVLCCAGGPIRAALYGPNSGAGETMFFASFGPTMRSEVSAQVA
jgi:hypothetical protein